MIRKYSYLFWLAAFIAGMIACSILNHREKQRYLPGTIARTVEQRLDKTLRHVRKDSADGFFSRKINGDAGSAKVPDYIVFIYKGDSLTSWSSNLLNTPVTGATGLGDSLVQVNNFYCYRKVVREPGRSALVFIPIASVYKYDNAFLQSQLLAFPSIGSGFSISGTPAEHSVAIKAAAERKTVAYLSVDDNIESGRVPTIYLQVIFIAALFALFIAVIKARDVIAIRLNVRYGKCFVLLFVFVLLFILRTFVITSLPFNLENTLWVSPSLMSSNNMLRSFLDLAVYAILGCAALYDVGISMRYFKRSGSKNHYLFKHRVWAVLIIFSCFFIVFFMAINSIDVLVIDSKIPFDVYDFFSLNQYTFIGLFVLLVITFDILILLRIARAAVIFGFRNVPMRYLVIIITMLIVCLLNYRGQVHYPEMATMLLLLLCMQFFGVIPFLYVPLLRANRQAFSASMYIWMMIVCTGVAWALMYFNFIKEHETRKVFAQDQAGKPDIEAEINLAAVLQRIQDDDTLKIQLQHKDITDSAAQYSSDYVVNKFLGDKFGQYKKYVYVFSKAGIQLNKRNDLILGKVKSAINATPAGSNVINDASFQVLYNHNFPKYTYWARIPVITDGNKADTIASLGILLSHDIHYTGNVYADLNQRNEITDRDYYLKYTFAHYLNNHLIYTNGYDFNNNIAINTHNEFTFRERLNRSVLIYSFSPEEQLVVNYDRNLLYIFIATFSYFALTVIVSYILFFVLRNFVVAPNLLKVKRLFKGSNLKTKINVAILLIVSLSLVIVGVFTISFLVSRFKNEQKQYLHHRVEAALSVMFGTNPYNTYIQTAGSIDSLQVMLPRLFHYATIENLTINIYNTQGALYKTNRPNIRKAGMISNVMNPSVLTYLRQGNAVDYITREYYGNLLYESIYACINNEKGATVGYINIPYYATNASVTSEISDVLVALINLYAFIFFIAGLVAILISNNVIKSFKLLRRKFQQVNIRHNEPIHWPYRDEIGQLVTEYNAMIHRVEHMATKLAHTERELAWREIAQQVAHEIKNPLTPMKLQIQYLQSAMQAKRDDVPELSRKVTESLLEQVENLNLIAGAFSDFARVPVAYFEYVDLKQFLPPLVCLFDTRDVQVQMQFEHESVDGLYYIEADKSFLNRIFTNLIKNALQSVPPGREAQVMVSVHTVMNKVIIAVSDNGKGIDEAIVPQIFTPYFTTKSSGTGLGLSMIKNMVEQMNGTISFKTKQDTGTTFYLTFPKVK